MKTTEQGRLAEKAVAHQLEKDGFTIKQLNWRTPRCEIDIVAVKDDVVYFVEVKYRSSSSQGEGFEYITYKKQSQMNFAAQLWIVETSWTDDWRLMAAAVSGPNCEQVELVEL